MVLTNGRVKPLRDILREDDFDDLEFRLAPSMLEGSGRWQKKAQRFAFDEGMGPDPVIDRMRDTWRGGKLFKEGGESLYKTRAGIGEGEVNGRIDVAKAETLLEQAGAMDLTDLEGPTGFWADDKEAGIRKFQTANGLKTDGKMLPHGETMRALEAKLAPKSAIKPVKVANAAGPIETKSDTPWYLLPESEAEKAERAEAKRVAAASAEDNGTKPDVAGKRPNNPPPISNPTGGVERNDSKGLGNFGASRAGGKRKHQGTDITVAPGDPVVAPIEGKIVRRGRAYSEDKRFDTVEIQGTGKYSGMTVKIFYVDREGHDKGPNPVFAVKAGTTVIGGAQDVRIKHGSAMKPHVHLEVYWQGKRVDPSTVLP